MPYTATDHHRHAASVIGNGHCVAYVREVTGLPPTAQWRQGEQVQGSDAKPGTAIATFGADGCYANSTAGDSHAAILLAVHDDGSLLVADQWLGQPVHQRVIRNRYGRGDAVNDASRFFCIELAEPDD